MIKIRLYENCDENWWLFNIDTRVYMNVTHVILSLDIRASEYIIPKKLNKHNSGYGQNYLQLY